MHGLCVRDVDGEMCECRVAESSLAWRRESSLGESCLAPPHPKAVIPDFSGTKSYLACGTARAVRAEAFPIVVVSSRGRSHERDHANKQAQKKELCVLDQPAGP